MARRSGKISNIRMLKISKDGASLIFVRHQSIFRATQNILINLTYIYMQQEPFFVNTYFFSVQH